MGTYAQINTSEPGIEIILCPKCDITTYGNCVSELCNGNFESFTNYLYGATVPCTMLDNTQCFCEWTRLRNPQGDFHGGYPTLYHPTFGSAYSTPGVPANYFGIENDASTGNLNQTGYAGILLYAPGNKRQYLMQRNGYVMTAGNTYLITFKVSLAEASQYATSLQMYIGPGLPNFIPSNGPIGMSFPVTHYRTTSTITNFNGWSTITFTYTATTSGLHYIYLGNFKNNATTPVFPSNTPNLPGLGKFPISYVYVDDFNIIKLNPQQELCCNFDHVILGNDNILNPSPDNFNTLNNYPINSGDKVFIYRYGWIVQNVTYNNVDFLFDANATLYFENGINVTFNNCRFRGCYAMWEGMQAFSGNVNLIFNNCIIEDMEAGINLTSGSPVVFQNCRFLNNRKSLSLKNFNGIWPISLSNNQFRKQGNFKPFYYIANPVLPASTYVQPEVHIEIKHVNKVNVVAPPGINNRNRFMDAVVGISLENSGLTLSNAWFQQIKFLPGSSNYFNSYGTEGAAVFAKNFNTNQGTAILKNIQINKDWDWVRIVNCDNGVNIQGNYSVEINDNWFYNLKNTAVKVQHIYSNPTWNTINPQIKIRNNLMELVTIGVDLYNNGNTLTEVKENTIQNSAYRDRSVAIRAQNLLLKPSKCKFSPNGYLNIKNNYTFRFETGIQADLCNCLKISGNEVRLNNPGWDQAHGIWVRSSLGALIDNNNIYGSGTHWYSQGIRLEFSPQTTISCNYVTNTENALWIHNNNNFSTIIGNTLMNYKYGLHLTYNGLIGSQLISGTQKYDLFNSFDLTPGGTDVDLFTSLSTFGPNSPFCFRNSIISDVVSSYDFTSNPISKDLANNLSLQNFCGTATRPVNSSYPIISGVYANENRWITKFKFAQVLKASADSASQLFNNPYVINQVNDSINTTVAEDILELDSLIEQKYWNEAWGKIYSTNPTHPIEELNLSSSEIVLKYLPVLWNGQDTSVNSGDVNWLFDVANRCPYQWGEVVFQARIFIHRYIDADAVFMDNCLPYAPNAPRLMQPEVDGEVYVYPNPATEVLYVYKGNNEAFNYMIHDVQGRIVKQEAMKKPGEVISIEGLQAGCYYITLTDGTIHKTLPFVKN